MQQNTRHILFLAGAAGIIGIFYFLCLIVHLPFALCLVIVMAVLIWGYRELMRGAVPEPADKRLWVWGLPVAAIAVLAEHAYDLAPRQGLWDAWAIWNLHAKFLANPELWQNMFLNTKDGHPDYPLALPGVIAFFTRLAGGYHWIIPYAFHAFVLFAIPVLIYLETYRKRLFVAGLSLLFFALNDFYVVQGTLQLADTLLAFNFLCAFICFEHGRTDRKMLTLSAFFLGLCIWTKNEGAILAGIFILFHAKEIWLNRTRFAIGVALPLSVWLIFKTAYAPANDMITGQSADTWKLLFRAERYELIYHSLSKNLNQHFKLITYLTLAYLLYCVIRKKWPDRRSGIILTCLVAYFMVYVVSPQDLEWHLFTSQSRLLHQLMPVTVYVFAQKFAGGSGDATNPLQVKFFSNLPRLR